MLNETGQEKDRRPGREKRNEGEESIASEERIARTDEEWRQILGAEAYHILREKGTEPPNTGEYVHNTREGIYLCAGCGNELFSSKTKYESGSGWPSFWEPIGEENIETEIDRSLYMRRTGVKCRRCGGHLGHVFEDGPKPTGLRYCLNSAALSFKEGKDGNESNTDVDR